MSIDTTLDNLSALVGQQLGASEPVLVTQERIDGFAEATEDRQWIHTDPVRAASGPFGSTIAHGFLSLSLLAGMTSELLKVNDAAAVVNYGLEMVRFPTPVPVGSTVHGEVTLSQVDEIPGGVQATLLGTVVLHGATKPAAVASVLLRFYR